MQPLKGLTVVTLEHAIAAPFATRQLADLGARVIKIERPGVGDFARGYDQRVRGLASHFVWTNRSQGEPDAGRQAPRGRQGCWSGWCSRRPTSWCRTSRPAPRRGWAWATSALTALQARHHRLRHLGLWRRRRARPLPRQEGLRPADPERGRLRLGHRHARRAVQGRPVDRRHRRRHVRLQQHPGRAAAARADRPGPAHRHLDARSRWPNGSATRCTTPSTARRRRRAPAPRTPRSTPTARSRPATAARVMLGLQNEREWVQLLRQGAAAAGAGAATRASPATPQRVAERVALRADHRRGLRAADRAAGGRAARGGADRQRPRQHHARALGSTRS